MGEQCGESGRGDSEVEQSMVRGEVGEVGAEPFEGVEGRAYGRGAGSRSHGRWWWWLVFFFFFFFLNFNLIFLFIYVVVVFFS